MKAATLLAASGKSSGAIVEHTSLAQRYLLHISIVFRRCSDVTACAWHRGWTFLAIYDHHVGVERMLLGLRS
jgi:hypothetical protein